MINQACNSQSFISQKDRINLWVLGTLSYHIVALIVAFCFIIKLTALFCQSFTSCVISSAQKPECAWFWEYSSDWGIWVCRLPVKGISQLWLDKLKSSRLLIIQKERKLNWYMQLKKEVFIRQMQKDSSGFWDACVNRKDTSHHVRVWWVPLHWARLSSSTVSTSRQPWLLELQFCDSCHKNFVFSWLRVFLNPSTAPAIRRYLFKRRKMSWVMWEEGHCEHIQRGSQGCQHHSYSSWFLLDSSEAFPKYFKPSVSCLPAVVACPCPGCSLLSVWVGSCLPAQQWNAFLPVQLKQGLPGSVRFLSNAAPAAAGAGARTG